MRTRSQSQKAKKGWRKSSRVQDRTIGKGKPRRKPLSKTRRQLKDAQNQRLALLTIERIYEDLQTLYVRRRDFAATADNDTINPFTARRRNGWSARELARYQTLDADANFGRELLGIVMFSGRFRGSMLDNDYEAWELVRARVVENKMSLRMFAILRQIPYYFCYTGSPVEAEFGPMMAHISGRIQPGGALPNWHVHTMYLDFAGEFHRSTFGDENQENVEECSFIEKTFVTEPDDWPWEYFPHHPQDTNRTNVPPYPLCKYCNSSIVSDETTRALYKAHRKKTLCVCTKNNFISKPGPLVEITQYPSYDVNDTLTVNRGVRALSTIKKGEILAEYVGDIIGKDAEVDNWYYDPIYGFALKAPPVHIKDDEWESEQDPFATVSAGWNGNWTRFLNHKDLGYDVEFQTETIGGKMRIIATAKKDVEFGSQMFTNYGTEYFDSPDDIYAPVKKPFRKLD